MEKLAVVLFKSLGAVLHMKTHYIAWWNLENLFSIKGDPDRTDKLERTLDKELNGWTATVLDKKLKQLASIIVQMNSGLGPDILGVCEVESDKVLNQLVNELGGLGRTYKTVHADTQDKRGIDVAFIYDSKKFKVKNDEVFSHFVMKRFATRDILQVNFYSKPSGKRLVLIGNHWPSRSGGQFESEPYRMIAGETMAYFHQRILEVDGLDQAVVSVGDYNDEPGDRSLVGYGLSERAIERVKSKRAQSPYLYNLMWPLMGQGFGTYTFSGKPNMLDQVLVNRPMLSDDTDFEVDLGSVEILRFKEMVAKNAPKRFGRPSENGHDPTGFSDHFPIAVKVNEK